jgi:hypothetical protein
MSFQPLGFLSSAFQFMRPGIHRPKLFYVLLEYIRSSSRSLDLIWFDFLGLLKIFLSGRNCAFVPFLNLRNL